MTDVIEQKENELLLLYLLIPVHKSIHWVSAETFLTKSHWKKIHVEAKRKCPTIVINFSSSVLFIFDNTYVACRSCKSLWTNTSEAVVSRKIWSAGWTFCTRRSTARILLFLKTKLWSKSVSSVCLYLRDSHGIQHNNYSIDCKNKDGRPLSMGEQKMDAKWHIYEPKEIGKISYFTFDA